MESNTSSGREIVYCHQCEEEWYRDEHGIICPSCESEFTEIVEAGHDPRRNEQQQQQQQRFPTEHYAPDPDEDDIDDLRWERTGPDTIRLRGTYRTTVGGQQGQQQQGQAGGLMGLVGNILNGYMTPQGQQQGQQQGPNSPGRPASAPGSPPPFEQMRGGPTTHVRYGGGPGYSFTIATSSNANFDPRQFGGIGNGHNNSLTPRNANGPQPYQNQPNHLDQMLREMMMNIGVAPGAPGQMRGMPHPFHEHDEDAFGPGPFIMGGGPGMPGAFAQLLNMFGTAGGSVGDAVYSQEALDRIITQLMEQHQAGNAPGPASEAAIKALPRRAITAADQGESGKAECSICMDEVPLGENVTELPCRHWFHFDCIRAWLGEHDTCPHCRQGITPADGGAGTSQQPRSEHQPPLHDMRSPEYTRPAGAGAVPGAYPFPRQGSFPAGAGPQAEQRRNSEGGRGVFGRMRDAFSGSSRESQSKNSRGSGDDGGDGGGGDASGS